MELKDLFKKEISFFNKDLKSKEEVISFLSEELLKNNFINSKEDFEKAVYKRESEGSTGVGDGIAIPHVLNPTVKNSAIGFVKLKNKIDWQSLDDQPVDLVFMIMTNGKDGNEHLSALADLSGYLMKADVQSTLRNSKNVNEIKNVLTKDTKVEKKENSTKGYDLIGITACPTGIAHTYMAAEKLEEYAKQKGYTAKIETQGRRGIENRLTADDIENAKVIIFAHDKALEGLSRFNGKQVIDTSTKEAIFKGPQLIEKFEKGENLKTIKAASDEGEGSGELTLRKFLDIKGNLLGGLSRMLPFVVAGGIILGIAFLIDFAAGNGDAKGNFGVTSPVAGWFAAIGKTSMTMMVPIFGAYIAYSIVGSQGLMPGMIAGLFSTNVMNFAYGDPKVSWSGLFARLLPENIRGMESGFIGAIFGGYLAALLVFGWSKAMNKFPKSLTGVRDIVFIPVISLLSISLCMFAINIPLGYLMRSIQDGIQWLAANNLLVLASVLAGFMMCVDMGGPINKIAYALGNLSIVQGLITDPNATGYDQQTIIMASAMIAGMVPPIMIALCTVIFPKVWTIKDRDAAKANWLMGACFVSEGAIPFMVKDPKRVAVSAMIGGTIVGIIIGLGKVTLLASHGGVFVFALLSSKLVDSSTSLTGASIGTGIGITLTALIIACFISASVLGFWRMLDIKRGVLVLDSTNGVKDSINAKLLKLKNNPKEKTNNEEKILKLQSKLSSYEEYESNLKLKNIEYLKNLEEKRQKKVQRKTNK
ncbi:PTS fructose transporter subunit IIABC [Spiroplasma turonicum]|uniref:PTS system fructose-specific IIABC component n=1 Tax=Spiroplasma turonicum TaxID=216946 RepID=A0A0K1P6V4_9MOLU|nr:fructose-specific PTS transporter subunit EIIC [Spiroplasma turonicum]AKU79612.1 PTS system fructose-specific IIABC component [Spiroplasma turonicum]ALX70634.1 PTS system, fructose-specific IIB component [Spiroplasma turonicum]